MNSNEVWSKRKRKRPCLFLGSFLVVLHALLCSSGVLFVCLFLGSFLVVMATLNEEQALKDGLVNCFSTDLR